MLDSASKIIIDGVEYQPVELPVEEKTPPVYALVENVEPWYAFIKATRFWVMILGALSIYLESKGFIGEAERNLIATVSAIFITVSTLDRGAEKMGK